MAKITYHSRSGRFCKSDSAAKVVKGGEQFKVVRQHRRVKPKAKPAIEQLPSSKWLPLSEVLAALGVRRRGL